jgi:hypothetical protein
MAEPAGVAKCCMTETACMNGQLVRPGRFAGRVTRSGGAHLDVCLDDRHYEKSLRLRNEPNLFGQLHRTTLRFGDRGVDSIDGLAQYPCIHRQLPAIAVHVP